MHFINKYFLINLFRTYLTNQTHNWGKNRRTNSWIIIYLFGKTNNWREIWRINNDKLLIYLMTNFILFFELLLVALKIQPPSLIIALFFSLYMSTHPLKLYQFSCKSLWERKGTVWKHNSRKYFDPKKKKKKKTTFQENILMGHNDFYFHH